MSMSNENLHEVLDTLTVIESTSPVFWQKYVKGHNLTFFDCPDLKCLPPVAPNAVRLLGHVKHTEYVRTTNDSVSYYSSLIVPMFQQLARRVSNLSIELYVSRTADENVHQIDAIEQSLSTAADRVPFIYSYDSTFPGVTCAPPLYLINQLQILTARTLVQTSVENIFNVFSLSIWCVILAFYLTCVAIELFSSRGPISFSSLWSTLANYYKALLEKDAQDRRYNRWLFICWVLGCIPLVEIFRNDMIARIVENKYREVDNIEELLATDLSTLATAGDLTLWSSARFISYDNIEFESTRQNYRALFNRTEALTFSDAKWLDVLASPRQMIEVFRSSAILEDEFAIKFFERVLGEFTPMYLSEESYFPQHISPICYNQNFTYSVELQQLSRELFEKGFLSHWNMLKQNYYSTFGKRLFRLLSGDDVMDRIHLEVDRASQHQTMANLFEYFLTIYLVLTVINGVSFLLEIFYFVLARRKRSQSGNKTVQTIPPITAIDDRFCSTAPNSQRSVLYSSYSY